ncbi:MAG TPA: hypothetical protein VN493_24420 [Thermoanaerobaculia bacterium]|nr:hypothetical protein [Thermoanaerobaculia bacterium]
MDSKQTPWLLSTLAFAAVLLSAVGIESGKETAVEAGASSVQQVTAAAEEVKADAEPAEPPQPPPDEVRLYREFFGVVSQEDMKAAVEALGAIRNEIASNRYELGSMIALVPDPRDSYLSYRFDEAVAAIQGAYAEQGFLSDRLWIPWEAQQDKPAERPYRQSPGVLLFRRPPRLEAVFLVGESPKTGIQKGAFHKALVLARALQSIKGQLASIPREPIRILGPTFSGSMESLRLSLRKHLPTGPSKEIWFEVVSGSATAPDLETFFKNPRVRFSRTVVSDNLLEKRAFGFLERLGWEGKRTALLIEADTTYGQGFIQRLDLSDKELEVTPDKEKAWTPGLVLRFPSQLAQIRTAREGELGKEEKGKAGSELLPTEPTRKTLGLSLADQDKPVDIVPQFTPLSTTINDLALANLLEKISREKARYVGIIATDIQDKLFLAEQLRTLTPNVVLFSFDSHLLDTHPQFAAAMDGTVVLSSHPLSLEKAQEKDQTLRQFSSDFQLGVFKAATHLLKEESPPGQDVWISAVSNGVVWPLALLAPEEPAQERRLLRWRGENLQAGQEINQIKWLLAGAMICCLAGWLLSQARPLQEFANAAHKGWSQAWPERWTRDARRAPALGAAALVLASALLVAVYSLPSLDSGQILVLLLLILAYVWIVWAGARLSHPYSPLGPKRWIWILAAVLLVLVLRLAMLWLWVPPEGERFAFSRIGNFNSGLSPLVSLALLLIGIYAWAVLDVKRLRLIALQGMEWPLTSSAEAPLRECRAMAEDLDRVLLGSLRDWRLWAVLGVLLLLPQRRLHEGLQPIAEAAPYGWPFMALVALAFILAAISFYRFFLAWRQLERILDRLCHTWLLRELGASSKLLDWKPMKSFGLRMPTFKMTVLALKRLEAIERLGLLEGKKGKVKRLEDLLATAFSAEREKLFQEEVEARREVLSEIASSTAVLAEAHRKLIQETPPPDPLPEPDPRSKELKAVEQFLAVRVVTYLRYAFAHLRNYLLSFTFCGLAALVGVNLYAFEPKQFFSFGIWVGLLACAFVTIWVFAQMDRNAALSAVSHTDAGQVSFDRTFFKNAFTYGAVPLISVVVTQFPIVGRVFSQWLDPLLRVVGAK